MLRSHTCHPTMVSDPSHASTTQCCFWKTPDTAERKTPRSRTCHPTMVSDQSAGPLPQPTSLQHEIQSYSTQVKETALSRLNGRDTWPHTHTHTHTHALTLNSGGDALHLGL